METLIAYIIKLSSIREIYRIAAFRACCDGYLFSPMDLDEFNDLVRNYVQTQS